MTKSIFTEEYQIFLNTLIQTRKNADITQVELAQMLKKPQSYVSKYENGERRLDVIETFEILIHLQIKPHLFFDRLEKQLLK